MLAGVLGAGNRGWERTDKWAKFIKQLKKGYAEKDGRGERESRQSADLLRKLGLSKKMV